jgi:molecular chaperone DnaJ
MNKNYYDILGLDKNASEKEIKDAFRTLSKKYHPDVCKDPDATEKFKEINEAYQVLSDKDKRQMYDMYGTVDPNEMRSPFDDLDPFGMFRGQHQEVKERGTDLRITIDVTLKEVYEGVHKRLKIKKQCTCHRCHGSGSDDNSYKTCPTCGGKCYTRIRTQMQYGYSETIGPCKTCNGTGKVIEHPCIACNGTGLEHGEHEVEFDIPKGMPFDAYFVLKGEGNDGPHRGIPGNLMVVVTHSDKDDTKLVRDGNDILYTLKLSYTDLIYGCDASVPYFNGSQKIHIAEGTESGKVVSLYRKGFPDVNDPTVYGNYKITIECDIPKLSEMTEKQKKAVAKLSEVFSK